MSERLQAGEPAGEDRRDAIERQLGVNAQKLFGLALTQALGGVRGPAQLEFRQLRVE